VPSKEERIGALREYLELAEKFGIEFAQVKKQAMYFLERTLPDRDFKEKLEECGDKREIKGLLKEL
jgi:hypothetical protein